MEEVIEYDPQGRMKYHPDFHENNGKPWTTEDIEYLCKFIEHDTLQGIGFALGRTEGTVANKLMEIRKRGLYEFYKNRGKYW